MSFAQRAKAAREEGAGGFVFPKLEGWSRLKGWKFGLTKPGLPMPGKPAKPARPMFTLELKLLDEELTVLSQVKKRDGTVIVAADLKGKIVKERVLIDPALSWQFDRFLAYLEDSGMDLSAMDDQDPNFQDIQDALEYLEDQGQRIKISLDPQEDDPRYYRLKFLEIQKVGDAVGGPVAVPPTGAAPAPAPAAASAPATAAAPPVAQTAPTSAAAAEPAPAATTAAPPSAAAPVDLNPPARKKKPWEK